MKLLDPRRIEVQDDVAGRLSELDEALDSLNELRETHGATIPAEARDLDLAADAVHDSAAIEGLASSRRQTILLLRQVVEALPSQKIPFGSQIQNLYKAVVRLGELVGEGARPSCATVVELRDLLMGPGVGPQFNPRGGWRRENVLIRRGEWVPPPWSEVPALMQVWEDHLDQAWDAAHPIVIAAWAHHAVAQVHPFMDGNGRTARLVQDHVLWCKRCAPAIIRVELQQDYYGALEAGDRGDLNPLVRMVAEGSLGSAQRLSNAYRAKVRRREWADTLASVFADRVDAVDERAYGRWRTAFENLRDAFKAGAEALADALEERGIQVRLREYPILDARTWRSIPREGRAAPHWYFTVSFTGRGVDDRYIFSFGRHFALPGDPSDENVGIIDLKLALKRDGARLDLHRDPEVAVPTLRAVWAVGERLRARVVSPSLDGWERLDEVDADELARTFYTEILRSTFGF